MKKSKLGFWGFVLPSFAMFTLVVLIPAVWGVVYSFTDWNGISKEVRFVGFRNYIQIFTQDGDFLHAFLFTAVFSILAVACVNLVGFLLALLVTSKAKGTTLMRGAFFYAESDRRHSSWFHMAVYFCTGIWSNLQYYRAGIFQKLALRYEDKFFRSADFSNLAACRLYDADLHCADSEYPR